MENNNMWIYDKVREVPEEAQKSFDNGTFKGTDINPMWRIKILTEVFGPCGVGWYYEVLSERAEEHHDMTMAIVDLKLYVKINGEWSKPIYGTGGNTLVKTTAKRGMVASDEGYKMALTDALSVACKALGVGADIYFAKDRTKYTQYADGPDAQQEQAMQAQAPAARTATTAKDVGQQKLAAMAAQDTTQYAVPGQVQFITAHAPENELTKMRAAYGPNLERMPFKRASDAVKHYQDQVNAR